MLCNILSVLPQQLGQKFDRVVKKVHSHSKIIISKILVDIASPMLYTRIMPQSFLSSGEENFKCLTIFLFVCHYWQWPILINCVMCYYLCVLRWLMRPILALNCLLQIEQERSEEESSVGDALALAFRCARFCSASLIRFASYSPAPLFMRPRHFVRSCVICSHDSVGMLKSLREALRVSLYRFFWPPWERFPTWSSP